MRKSELAPEKQLGRLQQFQQFQQLRKFMYLGLGAWEGAVMVQQLLLVGVVLLLLPLLLLPALLPLWGRPLGLCVQSSLLGCLGQPSGHGWE
jgi:hypothetical protein